ncbi:metallophosphoesterase [Tissierella praeacuta]|uniref:metallophosphoesterase n=1 Tax=Tissierella praeacuta TaxID=43131 RepID=UPI00333F98FA
MKLLKILFIIIAAIILGYFYNFNQISIFRIRDIKISSKKIKNSLKITQISDFHSNHLIDLGEMLDSIRKFNPDFIVLTGDIIDHNDKDLDTVIKLFKTLSQLNKDIYFVQGNHEARQKLYEDLKNEMKKLKINILENSSTTIIVKDQKINLMGLKFYPKSREDEEIAYYREATQSLDFDCYNILLRHSPNNIEDILNGEEDLILSGHTHGGQIRFPFVGAIVAPGQELFPKYDKGIYKIKDTNLYIDSGLGNSVKPIRAFNPVQFSNITIEVKK